ncbi:MAG TPA: hypothetical protein VJW76_08180 [Verrucomicrobiae bacterium]|nr:hypothetical protein [Verrucomicrobiae bacterium]
MPRLLSPVSQFARYAHASQSTTVGDFVSGWVTSVFMVLPAGWNTNKRRKLCEP